jgi:hypothetical protein
MPLDVLLISASLALMVLTCILIALFIRLNKSLVVLSLVVAEMAPMIGDMRVIGANLAVASDGLRSGVQDVKRLTQALGHVGDDIESGHQVVSGGAKIVSALWGPLQSFFKRSGN